MPTALQTALILLFAFASLPDSAAFAGMVLLSASHWAVVRDVDGADSEGLDHTTPPWLSAVAFGRGYCLG